MNFAGRSYPSSLEILTKKSVRISNAASPSPSPHVFGGRRTHLILDIAQVHEGAIALDDARATAQPDDDAFLHAFAIP